MVSKVKGRFSKVEGTITVADDVLESTVEATIPAASIDTRDENRDNHLRSADFFDVETYPELTFRSTGIRPDGDDFLLDGDLTIRGNTRPVTFELEYNGAAGNPLAGGKPTAGFSAETEISRKDFGLEWNVALETGGVHGRRQDQDRARGRGRQVRLTPRTLLALRPRCSSAPGRAA